MARKIGFWTIREFGGKLCRAITKFGPLIQAAYPENQIIGGLLQACYVACDDLVQEITNIEGQGV